MWCKTTKSQGQLKIITGTCLYTNHILFTLFYICKIVHIVHLYVLYVKPGKCTTLQVMFFIITFSQAPDLVMGDLEAALKLDTNEFHFTER